MPRPELYSATAETSNDAILVCAIDQQISEELALVIAATGRPLIQGVVPKAPHAANEATGDIALGRFGTGAKWRQCAAIVLDPIAAEYVRQAKENGVDVFGRVPIILVASCTGDMDENVSRSLGAVTTAVVPAENIRLVSVLGRKGPIAVERAVPRSAPDDTVISTPRSLDDVSLEAQRGTAPSVAVVPAVGGAGASVMAACLAMQMALTCPCCLIDADEYSGGADLLLGMESELGVRWGDLGTGAGQLDPEALFNALPAPRMRSELKVLTSSRSRELTAAEQQITPDGVVKVLTTLVGNGVGVVIDVPREPAFMSRVSEKTDMVAIVLPLSVRGIAAAGRLAGKLRGLGIEPVALVRAQRSSDISVQEVEQATGLHVAGEVRYLRGLSHEIDVAGLGRSTSIISAGLAPIVQAIEDVAASHGRKVRHG